MSALSAPEILFAPWQIEAANLDARLARLREDGDERWDHVRADMMCKSCMFFAQEVLSGPPEPPYNGRFFVGPHHLRWDGLITQYKRLCVLAPRDHGKSWAFSLALPLWQAVRRANGQGFIFSSTKVMAERILYDIKNEIEQNPKLQWLYPTDPKRRWSQSFIRLANGHRIWARGWKTRVRGAHPDWIDCDDVLADNAAFSETERLKDEEFFYGAVTNMVVPGGQIYVVGTPMHQQDLYGSLAKNRAYHFHVDKALGPGDVPLWPERHSKESLLAKREEIGTIRFARELQCEPISDDMSLFPKHLFYNDPTEQRAVTLGMPLAFWLERDVTPFMAADFALSSNITADYTVIWVMGLDKQGNRWIIDIIRLHGAPYQEQLSVINATGRKYDPALVGLEANQAQRIFGDELIRTTDLPIQQYTTGVEKNALDKGIPSLRVLLENGKFRIPRGDAHSVKMTDIWINEMHNFTYQKGKLQSVGGHDDTVMACWICNQMIRQGAFSFSFGDEELKEARQAAQAPTPSADAPAPKATAPGEAEEQWDVWGNPILQPGGRGGAPRRY